MLGVTYAAGLLRIVGRNTGAERLNIDPSSSRSCVNRVFNAEDAEIGQEYKEELSALRTAYRRRWTLFGVHEAGRSTVVELKPPQSVPTIADHHTAGPRSLQGPHPRRHRRVVRRADSSSVYSCPISASSALKTRCTRDPRRRRVDVQPLGARFLRSTMRSRPEA